jgi:PAS domain S-box-containing protein
MKRFLLIVIILASTRVWAQDSLRTIIIGGDYNYPPYEFINEAGEPDGYNVELSKAIAAQLGFKPVFKLGKWAQVRAWLDEGEIDLIQGMAFSLERAQILHFSNAHTLTWRGIFIRKGSKIKSETDLINASIVIQQGDIAGDYLRQINFQGLVSEVPTQDDALKLLNQGDFDAAIVNYMMGMYIVQQHQLKHLTTLPQRIHQREYCFVAKDSELISQINSALTNLSSRGILIRIQDKWFGTLELHPQDTFTPSKGFYLITIPLLVLLLILTIVLWRMIVKLRMRSRELKSQLDRTAAAEQELRHEYDSFTQGPVIVYKTTDHHKLVRISQNISEWGYTAEEVCRTGLDFFDLIYSEDRERIRKQTQEFALHTPVFLHYRVLTFGGELRWVFDYCRLLPSHDGTCNYIYGYLMDVSDQKRMEAQLLEAKERAEAANIAKGHFLANMSHEIRTPLNGIMGFLQVLMQMEATEQQREFYDIMLTSSRNLMKIINDILDFSKIESGKMDLIISDFNPRYLIEDVVKTFRINSRKPDLDIRTKIPETIPNVLMGDQLRLKQILINLIQNAVKFTDQGFVEIGVDIYTIKGADVRLIFSVMDTGIGIDPIKQKDIFDSYNQADSLITSRYGGTGLGLSIVKRLVELMHGFIWVESEKGKGSCFYFILPFSIYTEHQEAKTENTQTSISFGKLPQARILLVEDEPINQQVTRHQLESWDIQVTIAPNGADAIRCYKQQRYDLILMDIQMPVMDGITATHKIRALEAETHTHTPIIAFTAAVLIGDRERFLAAGMDDYIAKPIDMQNLYEIIKKYITSGGNQ